MDLCQVACSTNIHILIRIVPVAFQMKPGGGGFFLAHLWAERSIEKHQEVAWTVSSLLIHWRHLVLMERQVQTPNT